MRGSGWTLIVLGVLSILCAVIFDPALGAGADRVVNFGLLTVRLLFGVVGGSMLVGGCVLLGAEGVRDALAPRATPVRPTGEAQVNLDAVLDLAGGRRL